MSRNLPSGSAHEIQTKKTEAKATKAAGASQTRLRFRAAATTPRARTSGRISDHCRMLVKSFPRMCAAERRRSVRPDRYEGERALRRLKTFETPCAERHASHGTVVA